MRDRLPSERWGATRHFTIYTAAGTLDLYPRTGCYGPAQPWEIDRTGQLGELFVTVGKGDGGDSAHPGLQCALDSWAIALSTALQSSADTESLLCKFVGQHDPTTEGQVQDEAGEGHFHTSAVSLIAQWLLDKHCPGWRERC